MTSNLKSLTQFCRLCFRINNKTFLILVLFVERTKWPKIFILFFSWSSIRQPRLSSANFFTSACVQYPACRVIRSTSISPPTQSRYELILLVSTSRFSYLHKLVFSLSLSRKHQSLRFFAMLSNQFSPWCGSLWFHYACFICIPPIWRKSVQYCGILPALTLLTAFII